jgi:hypothetical protein
MENPRGVLEAVRVEFEPFIDERVRQFIINGIDYYSVSATSLPDYLPINFSFCAPSAATYLAGCSGWLQVSHLWVTEAARGARLTMDAESYARSRGAIGATVETHSFQARP